MTETDTSDKEHRFKLLPIREAQTLQRPPWLIKDVAPVRHTGRPIEARRGTPGVVVGPSVGGIPATRHTHAPRTMRWREGEVQCTAILKPICL